MPYFNHTFQEANEVIISAIRFAASSIRDFEEGTIALRYAAKDPVTAAWIGSHSTTDDQPHYGTLVNNDTVTDPNVDVDLVYSVVPGNPKTRAAGWRGDPNNPEVACAGYAALKLEGCAYAVIHDYGYCSDDMPEEFVTDGRVNSRGAVCFDIFPYQIDNGIIPDEKADIEPPCLRLYVAVSGATGEEDKYCAYQAIHALIELFFDECSAGEIKAPEYTPNFDEITLTKI